MGRVVAIEHMTLDGVIQAPARPDEDRREGFDTGGWGAARNDPLMQKVMGEHMGSAWALLVGRITYEDLASVWPKQTQPNPFTDILNKVEKFVASRTLTEPLPWQNSTLLKGDATDAIARLKNDHRTLVIFGSAMLIQSLMRRDLVDEYVLQIHPIVLGKGRRLFPDGTPLTHLKLAQAVPTSTGVTIAVYHRRPAQPARSKNPRVEAAKSLPSPSGDGVDSSIRSDAEVELGR